MKKNNLWRIIWIVGIYAILILILYLVVLYKVKWEDLDLRKYLYFYDCSNELCTSSSKVDKYYSKVVCDDDVCPFITKKYGNYVILNNNIRDYVFDYYTGKIISNEYSSYSFSKDNNLIAKNGNDLYGIIDREGNVLVDFTYDKISDYDNGFILYKKDELFGIDNNNSNIHVNNEYKDLLLINSKLYAYFENTGYHIASYDTMEPFNSNIYDYIYASDGIIFTVKNKQIDILGEDLSSRLIMRISTSYAYTTEKERESLDIHVTDGILHFSVYNGDNTYTKYKYDIRNNKII